MYTKTSAPANTTSQLFICSYIATHLLPLLELSGSKNKIPGFLLVTIKPKSLLIRLNILAKAILWVNLGMVTISGNSIFASHPEDGNGKRGGRPKGAKNKVVTVKPELIKQMTEALLNGGKYMEELNKQMDEVLKKHQEQMDAIRPLCEVMEECNQRVREAIIREQRGKL